MVFQGDISLSFLGIGLACDHRIATSETTFHNQERHCDMPPGSGLLCFLPAYVGLGRANKLVTRTAELSARSAFEWGLLDEVVATSELDQTVRTMAAEVSCFSPDTLATIKQLLNLRLPDFDNYFEMENQGLNMALRGRPWEKLPDSGPADAPESV
jgi:enoyl-CoA hydratase/carnithine racemase